MKQTTIHGIQSHWIRKRARPVKTKLKTVEEFEKDIMAIVKSSVPKAVTWQELLEETHSDTELSDLKGAIARGNFTAQEKRALGPQYDSIFIELAVVGGLVVRGQRIVVPLTMQNKVVMQARVRRPPRYHQDLRVPAYQSVVSRAGQNGGGAHPALPPVPSGERVTGVRAIMHDTHAQ